MSENTHKRYTIRKLTENLKGAPNHVVASSDVGSNPFPFTEENHISKEQFHFDDLDSLDHL